MSESTTPFNDQVEDALAQLNKIVPGADRSVAAGATYQAISHAVALGLQNAVAQQQHSFILRNALTTAAASALLDGKREEAEAVLKLAESSQLKRSLSEDVAELCAALRAMGEELRKSHSEAAPSERKPPTA